MAADRVRNMTDLLSDRPSHENTVLSLRAIQHLLSENSALKARMQTLENQDEKLRRHLSELERMLDFREQVPGAGRANATLVLRGTDVR